MIEINGKPTIAIEYVIANGQLSMFNFTHHIEHMYWKDKRQWHKISFASFDFFVKGAKTKRQAHDFAVWYCNMKHANRILVHHFDT